MTSNRFSFSLLAACLLAPAAWASGAPLELRWNELAPLVSGHPVEITLNEGKLRGEAIAIREDTLVVNVTRSSVSRYPKGSASIPRSAISLIQVKRERGSWGRTLGTVVGVVVGLGTGGFTAAHMDSAGPAVAVLVAITSGIAVLGYYGGKQLDRHQTSIRILP